MLRRLFVNTINMRPFVKMFYTVVARFNILWIRTQCYHIDIWSPFSSRGQMGLRRLFGHRLQWRGWPDPVNGQGLWRLRLDQSAARWRISGCAKNGGGSGAHDLRYVQWRARELWQCMYNSRIREFSYTNYFLRIFEGMSLKWSKAKPGKMAFG